MNNDDLKNQDVTGGAMEMRIYKDKYDAGIDFKSKIKRFLNKYLKTEYSIRDMPLRVARYHNKTTNAALAVIAGLYGNTGSQTAFTYGALGTSTTAVSASHTGLQAEIVDSGLSRVAATMSRSTTTQTNDTTVFTLTWTASGSKTIEEFGTFNNTVASGVSVMGARVLTGSQGVVSGNVINITYSFKHVGN